MKPYLILLYITFFCSVLGAQPADRSKAPVAGPPKSLKLPTVQSFKLANGLPVYLVQQSNLPLIQVNLVFNAGNIFNAPIKQGLASFTADLMDEGAGTRDALQLADEINFLGINLNAGAGLEQFTIRLSTPASKLKTSLGLLSDILLRPRFDPKEVERKRTEYLVRLAQNHDESRAISTVGFLEALYGKDHPYARSNFQNEAALRSFKVTDLQSFQKEYLTPANGYMIIVGDWTKAAAEQELNTLFKTWTGGTLKTAKINEPAKKQGLNIILVDKPGAAQTEIRFGQLGVSRSTPDYFNLEVMNTILGNSFTSRLNSNLREKNGYSYGAGSSFFEPSGRGYFMAGSSVQTDVTDKAVTEFLKELNDIRSVSDEEVTKAKNYQALGYPAEFSSLDAIAAKINEQILYKLPADYLNTYVEKLLKVGKVEVEKAAKTYIDPQNMTLFMVGDRAKIDEGLKALNLGKITYLTIDQVLGAAPKVENIKP
jgi:predicted Zn-dependent peptidase